MAFTDIETLTWLFWIILVCVILYLLYIFIKNKKTFEYQGLQGNAAELLFKSLPVVKRRKKVYKNEDRCRQILERIYGRSFPSKRPAFLKNPQTKKNLELDCFCEELNIALEYNGQQHYVYTPLFHRRKKDFYSQVFRDDWKRKKCKERGIRLVEIPYWVAFDDLESFIRNELVKKGCL